MARNKAATDTEKTTEDRFKGITTEGPAGYPHNHRLRAEALVEDGLDQDPDGMISDELIADTRARLEAEASAPEPSTETAEEAETADDTGVDTETETADEPLDGAA